MQWLTGGCIKCAGGQCLLVLHAAACLQRRAVRAVPGIHVCSKIHQSSHRVQEAAACKDATWPRAGDRSACTARAGTLAKWCACNWRSAAARCSPTRHTPPCSTFRTYRRPSGAVCCPHCPWHPLGSRPPPGAPARASAQRLHHSAARWSHPWCGTSPRSAGDWRGGQHVAVDAQQLGGWSRRWAAHGG